MRLIKVRTIIRDLWLEIVEDHGFSPIVHNVYEQSGSWILCEWYDIGVSTAYTYGAEGRNRLLVEHLTTPTVLTVSTVENCFREAETRYTVVVFCSISKCFSVDLLWNISEWLDIASIDVKWFNPTLRCVRCVQITANSWLGIIWSRYRACIIYSYPPCVTEKISELQKIDCLSFLSKNTCFNSLTRVQILINLAILSLTVLSDSC